LKTNYKHKTLKYIFFYVFLTCFNHSYSQTKDYDEDNFKKVVFHSRRNANTDSIQFYIKKLKKSKNQCRVLFAMFFEANTFYNDNKYKECTKILDKILYEIENNPKPSTFVYSESMVGKTYKETIEVIKLNTYRRFFFLKKNEKKLTEAHDYLLLMEDIINNLLKKDTYYIKNKISVAYSLASLKKVIGEKEESLEILLKINKEIDSIQISKNDTWYEHFIKEKANINVQIGRNYLFLGQNNAKLFNLAEQYFNKAYTITQQIDSVSNRNKAAHYLRIAELNEFKENFNLVAKYADSMSKHINKDKFNSGFYYIKSISHSKLKNPDSAIYYANKVVNNKKHIGLKYNLKNFKNSYSK